MRARLSNTVSAMSSQRILEGVFAIHKPPSRTSADIVDHVKQAFSRSSLFEPWLAREKAQRDRENSFQKKRRNKHKRLEVKTGHGGTLDPMATGVLVIGVGKGTKSLSGFLECTKSYETTVLFGAATDTYDVTGKLLSTAPYSHITRGKVEEVLETFRGNIMQRPPIFSALRIDGKRLYEYAREGKDLPKEIKERPVRVEQLEIVKWLEPGSHPYTFPKDLAPDEEQKLADEILHVARSSHNTHAEAITAEVSGEKRKRSPSVEADSSITDTRPPAKRLELDSQSLMSGALESTDVKKTNKEAAEKAPLSLSESQGQHDEPHPTGVVLRMTVTSGFYVRSLCHDLGKALGSLGAMATLVRSRQAGYELGKNCLEYDDLEKGEDVWGPKVASMLEDWQNQAPSKAHS